MFWGQSWFSLIKQIWGRNYCHRSNPMQLSVIQALDLCISGMKHCKTSKKEQPENALRLASSVDGHKVLLYCDARPLGLRINPARRHWIIYTPAWVQAWMRHPYPCQLDHIRIEQIRDITNNVVSPWHLYNCQGFQVKSQTPAKGFKPSSSEVCGVSESVTTTVLNGTLRTLRMLTFSAFLCTTL
jgi:hypothetical protein